MFEQMEITQATIEDILNYIMSNKDYHKYSYIISGNSGPTGKTTLCRYLEAEGCNVVDLSGYLIPVIGFDKIDENLLLWDKFSKVVIIILNKKFK